MGNSIRVLADDGSIHQFPDNTDPNVISNVLQSYHANHMQNQASAQAIQPLTTINASGANPAITSSARPRRPQPVGATPAGQELSAWPYARHLSNETLAPISTSNARGLLGGSFARAADPYRLSTLLMPHLGNYSGGPIFTNISPSAVPPAPATAKYQDAFQTWIPFFGPAQEAIADVTHGEFNNAGINMGRALSDLHAGRDDYDRVTGDLLPDYENPVIKPEKPVHTSGIGSFVPVFGSLQDAEADAEEGDFPGTAWNSAFATNEGLWMANATKALADGAIKIGENAWKDMRPYYGELGYVAKGQPLHHWAIPRNGWGKNVPNIIKNQWPNLVPMSGMKWHNFVEGKKFNGEAPPAWPIRFLFGTPTWWKQALLWGAGQGAKTADSLMSNDQDDSDALSQSDDGR